MRILSISDVYPPYHRGGYEIQCKYQMDELLARGHHVHVLTSKWRNGQRGEEANVTRTLEFHPAHLAKGPKSEGHVPGPSRWRGELLSLRWGIQSRLNYGRTKNLIAALRPDIALAWNMNSIGIHPLLALGASGVPLVIILYDYWLRNIRRDLDHARGGVIRRLRRSFYHGIGDFDQIRYERLIACSHSMKSAHLACGFRSDCISVVPLGLPQEQVASAQDPRPMVTEAEAARMILFAGRLIPDKGPDIAIDALSILANRLQENEIKLDIIGQGPLQYAQELKARAIKSGLGRRIRFLGSLSHTDMLQAYPQYDVFLFPSRWQEPFGLAILEAMAKGVPVIAAETGGPAEIITQGETGLLVPVDDPVALAEATARLLSDAALAKRIRTRSRRMIQTKYSITHVVDQLEGLLENALMETGRTNCI